MELHMKRSFFEFQTGVEEALTELDRLSQYCADTVAVAPSGALKTVQDLEGRIKDAGDLIRAHLVIFKRRATGPSSRRSHER